MIHITGSSASGKSLVIVRDSFASCLAPFFIADYTDIWLVDMRYASVDSVSEIRADDVLIIYNAKTFSEDTGIIRLSRAVIGKKD